MHSLLGSVTRVALFLLVLTCCACNGAPLTFMGAQGGGFISNFTFDDETGSLSSLGTEFASSIAADMTAIQCVDGLGCLAVDTAGGVFKRGPYEDDQWAPLGQSFNVIRFYDIACTPTGSYCFMTTNSATMYQTTNFTVFTPVTVVTLPQSNWYSGDCINGSCVAAGSNSYYVFYSESTGLWANAARVRLGLGVSLQQVSLGEARAVMSAPNIDEVYSAAYPTVTATEVRPSPNANVLLTTCFNDATVFSCLAFTDDPSVYFSSNGGVTYTALSDELSDELEEDGLSVTFAYCTSQTSYCLFFASSGSIVASSQLFSVIGVLNDDSWDAESLSDFAIYDAVPFKALPRPFMGGTTDTTTNSDAESTEEGDGDVGGILGNDVSTAEVYGTLAGFGLALFCLVGCCCVAVYIIRSRDRPSASKDAKLIDPETDSRGGSGGGPPPKATRREGTASSGAAADTYVPPKMDAVSYRRESGAATPRSTPPIRPNATSFSSVNGGDAVSFNTDFPESDSSAPTMTLDAFYATAIPKVADDNWEVPVIVHDCIDYLMVKGLTTEGIFRVPGNMKIMNDYLLIYNKGGRVDMSEVYDPLDVAGLLKLWTKSTPEAIVPMQLYGKLTDANNLPDSNFEEKTKAMRQVLEAMPRGRRECIRLIVKLFVAISDNHKVNKMKVNNIAMVYAPTLFKGMGIGNANSIVAFWVRAYNGLFE